jgi:hypothetical protein
MVVIMMKIDKQWEDQMKQLQNLVGNSHNCFGCEDRSKIENKDNQGNIVLNYYKNKENYLGIVNNYARKGEKGKIMKTVKNVKDNNMTENWKLIDYLPHLEVEDFQTYFEHLNMTENN